MVMNFQLILLSAILRVASAIIGGIIANEGSFKYQVSIWEDQEPICSGAVLGKWRILTVADCVADYPTDHFSVHAGSIIQRERNSSYYEVERIHLHPDYNVDVDDTSSTEFKHQSNNVAVLILRQPLPLGEHIESILLPTEENLDYCSFCKIAGWGLTGKILKWTFQTIYTPNQCLRTDSAHGSDEFCAIDPSNFSNPEEGDEGSPLVCDGIAVGIYVTSEIHPGFPMIYAKIFSFLPFINSIQEDVLPESPALSLEKFVNDFIGANLCRV